MKLVWSAALYTALALGANPAAAEAALAELRQGSMSKLELHETPRAPTAAEFMTYDGTPMTLAAYEGQVVALNFWATWCAPCRKEMPGLNALQRELGGDDFQVVTVATGRQSVQGIKRFFEDEEIDLLPMHRDPQQALAREMEVLGLPVTVLLDRDGREIGRLTGDAHWDSDSAKAIITALIGAQG